MPEIKRVILFKCSKKYLLVPILCLYVEKETFALTKILDLCIDLLAMVNLRFER